MKIVCKNPFVDISPSSILSISPYFPLLNSSRKFSWTLMLMHLCLSSSVTVVVLPGYVQFSVRMFGEIWAFSTVIVVSHSNSYNCVFSFVDEAVLIMLKHWCSHSWQFGTDPSDLPRTRRLDSFIKRNFSLVSNDQVKLRSLNHLNGRYKVVK